MSRSICSLLTSAAEWKQAEVILSYLPMPEEVNTEYIIQQALIEGKEVAVPRIRGKQLDFCLIEDLSCNWHLHDFGIRQPSHEHPVIELTERFHQKLLVITPGLGFDRSGNRLGRGGGFYDRFLKDSADNAVIAAVCFSFQIIGSVPAEPHDHPVDLIVTEQEVIRPQGY